MLMFVFLSFVDQLKEFHLNLHIAVDELMNIYTICKIEEEKKV